jgi:hypothetical protein
VIPVSCSSSVMAGAPSGLFGMSFCWSAVAISSSIHLFEARASGFVVVIMCLTASLVVSGDIFLLNIIFSSAYVVPLCSLLLWSLVGCVCGVIMGTPRGVCVSFCVRVMRQPSSLGVGCAGISSVANNVSRGVVAVGLFSSFACVGSSNAVSRVSVFMARVGGGYRVCWCCCGYNSSVGR